MPVESFVHLRSAASDITEQLSKETGGHARNSRWSWVQGMWAFPGRDVTVYRVNLQLRRKN